MYINHTFIFKQDTNKRNNDSLVLFPCFSLLFLCFFAVTFFFLLLTKHARNLGHISHLGGCCGWIKGSWRPTW